MTEAIDTQHMLNRVGTPEDVAKSVTFLARCILHCFTVIVLLYHFRRICFVLLIFYFHVYSDDSSFITGTTLFVDGGLTAQ